MISRFDRDLRARFAVVVVAVFVSALLSWRSAGELERSMSMVSQTHETLAQLQEVLRLVTDAQTATRGFVITGQDSLLDPYRAAQARMPRELDTLASLVGDNTGQRQRVSRLRELVAGFLAWREQLIDAVGTDGFEAGRRLVAGGEGERAMVAMREVESEMAAEERRVLEQWQRAAARDRRWTQAALTSLAVLGIVLVVAAYTFVHRHIAARVDAEGELIRVNDLLEHRVQERTAQLDASVAELQARIAAHERTLETLRVSEERFAKAFRATPDSIVLSRLRDGMMLEVNDASYRLYGLTREEIVGRTSRELNLLVDAVERQTLVERLDRDGFVRDFEMQIRQKSGALRRVSVSAERIAIEDEPCMLTVVRDITELAKARAALEAMNSELERRVQQRTRDLEHANRELEAFSYSVSHDLRAPLRHIHGYVDMLKRSADGQLSDKSRRYLETIAAASREMGVLIDDLLAFSRMGRTELRHDVVDLDALVRECLAGMENALRERRIDWTIAPLPRVVGDRAMLKQVLVNLLDNAVKYTRPRDPARIEIGCAGREDEQAVLFVRDNGVGFDPGYTAKLFGVFQRLHRADEFEGTGIGLASVRRIIGRHGGRTWAEGALDEGAAIFFTLATDEASHSAGAARA